MASISNFSFLMLLFLGIMLIIPPILAIATEDDHVAIAATPGPGIIEAVVDDYVDIVPTSIDYLDEVEVPIPPPEGSPQFPLFLEGCAERLEHKCGEETIKAIFEDGKSISSDCCLGMVEELGKECHDALVKYGAQGPILKDNFDYYVKKGQQEWDRCEVVVVRSPF